MNKLLTCFILFATTFALHAQNLVNNPDFELYTACPQNQGDMYATSWYITSNSFWSSPEYLHTCGWPQVSVPSNVAGWQQPASGNAYIGLFCYGGNSQQREYVQTQLTAPLIAGQTYQVTFKASLADQNGRAINKLGALFTDYPIPGNDTISLINATPQVIYPNLLDDYVNWVTVTGSFTAAGGEQYLTLGNFYPDSLSGGTIVNWNAPFQAWSYYYIDDVYVTGAMVDVNEIPAQVVNFFPNPFSTNLNIDYTSEIDEIKIYNSTGVLVRVIKGDTSIDFTDLAKGIYLAEIITAKQEVFIKKLIKL